MTAMEKIVIMPYGCKTQFSLTGKIGVMIITSSLSTYNEYESLPDSLVTAVEEVIGLNQYSDITCSIDLALVGNGQVLQTTKANVDIVNNRLLGLYKKDSTVFGMLETYGIDKFMIDKKIDIDYTDILVRMVDKYITIFQSHSTANKDQFDNLPTFREKLYTLINLVSEASLTELGFIGCDDFTVHNQMVYDFAILDGILNNKAMYSAWDITLENYELGGLLTGTNKDVTPLAVYAYDILVKSLNRLVEFESDNGVQHSIVSVGGRQYFDIDKKMVLKSTDIGKLKND